MHVPPRRCDAAPKIAKAAAGSDIQQIRIAATLQLSAVIEWLQNDQQIRSSNNLQPLYRLFEALHDLCAGGWHPFLFEVARPDDVKTKPKIAFAILGRRNRMMQAITQRHAS